jgi:hypothetical protein
MLDFILLYSTETQHCVGSQETRRTIGSPASAFLFTHHETPSVNEVLQILDCGVITLTMATPATVPQHDVMAETVNLAAFASPTEATGGPPGVLHTSRGRGWQFLAWPEF